MKRFLLIAAVSLACAQEEQPASDTTAATPTPASRTISLGDVAGTWEGEARRVDSDTVVARTWLTAAADTTGWSLETANVNRPDARTRHRVRSVRVEGDSLIVETDQTQSVLREGRRVSTRTVYRLQNGRLVGDVTAVYDDRDTVRLRTEATRR